MLLCVGVVVSVSVMCVVGIGVGAYDDADGVVRYGADVFDDAVGYYDVV